ncbi:MAG: low temperature requirement protein A [Ilumatobacter sp.]|uniref:low temperature requirement protein A n=1 Tax=Ilumatobacter sp. TaxID=1967498 RepID=UPI002603E7F6|nr:low temperature requirement protein A [Ilumatobacter sp.]MDJ0769487.1 low temperature requirement protein A [Ilumatobacter sp.]
MGESTALGPALKRWFSQPPRRHGEIDEERTVSFLELFYDLVFVVLIAQIAHTLAGHTSWSSVGDFAIVFGLIWIAWLNGTLYHELHGREDGRSRSYIFVQMLILVVLAVYAGHATDEDGQGFAIVYAVLLVVLTLQWYGVRRVDTAEWSRVTGRYIGGMVLLAALMVVSAFLDDDARVALWAGLVVVFVAGAAVQTAMAGETRTAIAGTESLSERLGLFTIIVLGEVVVGVVDGLSEAERDTTTIVTGLLALSVGFGFWWNYFDFAGRRVPRVGRTPLVTWLMVHLPMAAAIAGAGAGMVGLIEPAGDDRTPAPTAWLIGGSTALLLVSLAAIVLTIDYREPDRQVARSVVTALGFGAATALVVAALRPVPWLLASALLALLVTIWVFAFGVRARASRTGAPSIAS